MVGMVEFGPGDILLTDGKKTQKKPKLKQQDGIHTTHILLKLRSRPVQMKKSCKDGRPQVSISVHNLSSMSWSENQQMTPCVHLAALIQDALLKMLSPAYLLLSYVCMLCVQSFLLLLACSVLHSGGISCLAPCLCLPYMLKSKEVCSPSTSSFIPIPMHMVVMNLNAVSISFWWLEQMTYRDLLYKITTHTHGNLVHVRVLLETKHHLNQTKLLMSLNMTNHPTTYFFCFSA